MHVLIVDDDHDATELLAFIVQAEFPNATVECAYDGQQALDMATAHRPDFAVMDLEMPRMDGEAAASKIAACYGAKSPRLIALSGDTPRLAKLQGKGPFHAVQAKPCDVEKLLNFLRT